MTLPNPLFDLTGQKAIVTGGTGAIGGAIAEGLHEAGAELVIQGTTDRVHEAAAAIAGDGPACAGLVADLADRAQRREMFEQAVEHLGGLDILALAHGTIFRASAEDFPTEEWDRILELNLTSVFDLSQMATRRMLPRGRGKIILIASVLSFEGGITVPAYAASKGGLRTLTMALCNDWAARGVNVNGIAPGYIVSRLNAALRADPVRSRQILERIPAGRWGQPEDLKGAAVFLASRASDYVHGEILAVDGGWLAR
jgi:2-dehydro-3-deoxy-D-gluconate 5-dehydrogenase